VIIVVSGTFRDECLRAPSGLGKHPRAHHETIFRRPVDCRVVGPILRVADSKRGSRYPRVREYGDVGAATEDTGR